MMPDMSRWPVKAWVLAAFLVWLLPLPTPHVQTIGIDPSGEHVDAIAYTHHLAIGGWPVPPVVHKGDKPLDVMDAQANYIGAMTVNGPRFAVVLLLLAGGALTYGRRRVLTSPRAVEEPEENTSRSERH